MLEWLMGVNIVGIENAGVDNGRVAGLENVAVDNRGRLRWLRGTVVERRSLTSELYLFCTRPTADG